MFELKYPKLEAYVKSENGMQWLELDAVDYAEGEFLILDEKGNEHYYKLNDHDVRVKSEIVTKLN